MASGHCLGTIKIGNTVSYSPPPPLPSLSSVLSFLILTPPSRFSSSCNRNRPSCCAGTQTHRRRDVRSFVRISHNRRRVKTHWGPFCEDNAPWARRSCTTLRPLWLRTTVYCMLHFSLQMSVIHESHFKGLNAAYASRFQQQAAFYYDSQFLGTCVSMYVCYALTP
jgi:hypothetical protein